MALTISDVNEFPIVDEPYELTILACINVTVDSWQNNTTMLEYEKKTGVKINWIEVTDGDILEKIRLTLISGDTPDIILWWFSDTSMIQSFGSAGTIIALNDLIDEYSYYAKQELAENDHLKEMMTSTDGNIYTFWRYRDIPTNTVWNKQYVFMPWFEQYRTCL